MRTAIALALVLVAGRLPAADLTAGEQMEVAIDRGDIQSLKDIIEGGVDPDTPLRSDSSTTALMKAGTGTSLSVASVMTPSVPSLPTKTWSRS